MKPAPARAGALLATLVAASALGLPARGTSGERPTVRLAVEPIAQEPERCGPAALRMVLRFYRAGAAAESAAAGTYSRALRGALITDLAECARRLGFPARVTTMSEDSLHALLERGVPPVLYLRRGLGPLVRGHYAVLAGWDETHGEFLLNDGGPATVRVSASSLTRRWRSSGSQALVVEPREP